MFSTALKKNLMYLLSRERGEYFPEETNLEGGRSQEEGTRRVKKQSYKRSQ